MKFQQPALLELPKFKTAFEYRDKFTFGIDKLDSKLQLHLDDTTIDIFVPLGISLSAFVATNIDEKNNIDTKISPNLGPILAFRPS